MGGGLWVWLSWYLGLHGVVHLWRRFLEVCLRVVQAVHRGVQLYTALVGLHVYGIATGLYWLAAYIPDVRCNNTSCVALCQFGMQAIDTVYVQVISAVELLYVEAVFSSREICW